MGVGWTDMVFGRVNGEGGEQIVGFGVVGRQDPAVSWQGKGQARVFWTADSEGIGSQTHRAIGRQGNPASSGYGPAERESSLRDRFVEGVFQHGLETPSI